MTSVTMSQEGPVYVLDLGDTENRLHPDWLGQVEKHLDAVEYADGPRALVTCAQGKFFSNGLDLDWLSQHPDAYQEYVDRVHALFARLLRLPVFTVAALQGHTFAAGAMLSLTHDVRVMRSDRGFWCLPEVTIGIPFTDGMSSLIQARLTPQIAHEAMVTGRRYGGTDAAMAGIVDEHASADELLGRAVELAAAQAGLAGDTMGAIKAGMYAGVRNLTNPTPAAA
jgi:enoyl-CoA hydratase/carnithine racemase